MKNSKIFILSCLLILFVGFSTANATQLQNTKKSIYFTSDKQQLETLIRKTYEWVETKNSNNDFDPIDAKKGGKYKGLDQNSLKKRLEELKRTNFFSQQFLDNYSKIASKLDANLKNKKIEWLVGDMPPFGNGANPWCNCQDFPDEYWKTMKIKDLKIDNNKASLKWIWLWDGVWSGNYKVEAVKENGVWKISYLEGFDFTEFTKIY
ncbi:hypothetical protein ACQ9BO_10195 [Flavobacterium sp. P21]|uniref:hypothetical protein n=1 Tax=Flavobacterium sp. P21 TaxID=3423948 RepID=UPI003D66A01E